MQRTTPRSNHPRTDRNRARTIVTALVVAVALGACSGSGTVEAGDQPGAGTSVVDGKAPATPAAPTDPSPPQTDGAASPPTTCVEGPATTTPWDAGGGRIICTAPDQGSGSSPPMTDTTIPVTPTSLSADASHGVLVISATGGYECPPNEACIAIGLIMQGVVEVTGPGGTVESAPIDESGRVGFRLAPGEHRITAQVTPGSCAPAGASVTAGATVDVALACSAPMP